jgi:hypothetical protein
MTPLEKLRFLSNGAGQVYLLELSFFLTGLKNDSPASQGED